ncbi:MAG: glycoside-pentoside-hexuronide (GPH):cation symporter [Clostridiales bacterium]|nr:glycoside-pentoside-hexuronide (GPH):cation symporter [Clostridiales bacterium]
MEETTNVSSPENVQTQPSGNLSKRTFWMYPLGTVGRDFLYMLFNSNLITFILFTKTLTTAQFTSVSFIIIAARIFDAFNDPIMGGIVENTRSRFGRFKPWMFIGALLTGLVVIAVFSVPVDGWGFIGFLAVMYFLFSITFTMNDISYWGMLPSLTSNERERDKLTSFAQIAATAGGAVAGFIIPVLAIGANPLGGSAPKAFMIIAVASAVLMFGFQLFTVFGVKEAPMVLTAKKKTMGLKDMFRVIFKNDQLMWCALIALLYQTGTGVVGGGLSMSYIYFEFGYNGTLTMIFGALGGILGVVFTIIYPLLSKKFGRDKLLYSCGFAMVIGYALMLVFGLCIPSGIKTFHMDIFGFIVADIDLKFLILSIGNFIAGYGGGFYMIMVISIANTVEYNEWKTGNRDEGLIFSLRPFTAKMASALMQFLVMLVYLVVGVTVYTNGISAAENDVPRGLITSEEKMARIEGILATIPSAKKQALLACMCIIPIVFVAAAMLIYKRKYFLSEEVHQRMVKEIAEGRSEYQLKHKAETEQTAETTTDVAAENLFIEESTDIEEISDDET